MPIKVIIGLSILVTGIFLLLSIKNLRLSKILKNYTKDVDLFFNDFNKIRDDLIKNIVNEEDIQKREELNDLLDKLLDLNTAYISYSHAIITDLTKRGEDAKVASAKEDFYSKYRELHKRIDESNRFSRRICKWSEFGSRIITDLYSEYTRK